MKLAIAHFLSDHTETLVRGEREREGGESACVHTLKLLHACLLFTFLPFPLSLSYRYRIIINNNDNSPDIINCLSCEEEKAKKSLEN